MPLLDDEGQHVDEGLILVPTDELTIEDTWFAVINLAGPQLGLARAALE